MNLKRIFGILTLITAIGFISLMIVLYTQGVMFQAFLAQLAIFNFSLLVVIAGFYLMEFQERRNKIATIGVRLLGIITILFAVMVAFDIVAYHKTWNLLIGLGIIYITLIQMRVLKWENSKGLIKILGLITFLSNAFIAVFFLAKLSIISLGTVLDIAVITGVFSFLIGMIVLRKQNLQAGKA